MCMQFLQSFNQFLWPHLLGFSHIHVLLHIYFFIHLFLMNSFDKAFFRFLVILYSNQGITEAVCLLGYFLKVFKTWLKLTNKVW